jgi:hypothetical protein
VKHRDRLLWVVAALIMGLGLVACGHSRGTSSYTAPAGLTPIPGTSLHRVTLDQAAIEDLGIRSEPVRTAASATTAGGHKQALTVIPVTALIYDPQGRPWTYTIVAPRTFVRHSVMIDRIDGKRVFLVSGPPPGTPVVTVGAAELLGTEYGVGEE